jgi:D-aspartate ligase
MNAVAGSAGEDEPSAPILVAAPKPAPWRERAKEAGALVLGADYRGLTIVRSLGRRGIKVWVLPEQQRIAAKSRYALNEIPLPHGEDEQVEFLLELAELYDVAGWVLFATEDRHAALLARHRDKLARKFRVASSPWDIVKVAYDKRLTYSIAQELGLDIPLTFYPSDRAELAALECSFPVILKPAMKEGDNLFTHEKAWRVDDRKAMLEAYDVARTMVDPATIMVQELIPGGGESQYSYGAICDDGRPLASIVARRTRQYPVDFGRSSSFVESVTHPAVEDAAVRLLAALKFTGLMEAEFKLDSRDGRIKLLDLNPRVWGWHTLACQGGVDFPYFQWCLARGHQVPHLSVKPGYRWVRMTTDLPAAMQEIRRGRLSLMSYLRSLRRPIERAVFAADDPIPCLLEVPMLAMSRSVLRLHRRLPRFRGPTSDLPAKA